MRREDVTFVVSRALAVWVAALALREFTTFLAEFSEFVQAMPGDGKHFLGRVLAIDSMLIAGYIAISSQLWIRASNFGLSRHTESEIVGSPPCGIGELRAAILSGVGLMAFLQGISSLIVVLLAIPIYNALANAVGSNTTPSWRGSAVEAILGAAVFVGFTWGPQIRAWFSEVLNP